MDDSDQGASSALLKALLCDISEEGLTASALQECLSKLEVRREEVLLTLFANAAERFTGDLGDDGGLASELSCSAALASLQARALAEDEATVQLAAIATQHCAVCWELQQTQDAAAGVRAAAELHQRLADYDCHVARGAFTEAAWTAVELQKATAAAPGMEAAAAAVERRVEPLRQYLATAPPQYLAVDPTTQVPALLPPQDQTAAALGEVWRAASVLGVMPQALQALSEFLTDRCVKAALAAEAAQAAAGAGGVVMESPAGSVASSAFSTATGRADARAGAERAIYKTLKVVCQQALGGSAEMALQLGESLWPAVAGAYIAAKLRPTRPQGDAEVETLSRTGSLGIKLEAKAVKLGLLPADVEGPVARFMRQSVGRLLAAKRARYVVAARELLASSAAEETTVVPALCAAAGQALGREGSASCALFEEVGGVEAELAEEPSVLEIGEFTVTRAAEGLVNLMKEALGEGCRSGSGATAQAMCASVVDMAALLLALAPVPASGNAAAEGEALALPYPATLRHNDCLHVYRALCALPHLFAPRLQALVHESVNFVAPATRVKAAGDEALAAMVRREEALLVEIAVQVSAFREMAGPGVTWCRKGVMQLLHGFRRLGSVLRGVLPAGAFVEVATLLMEAVCGRIADDILAMPDIAVEESEQIPKILEDLTSGTIYDAVLMGSRAKQQQQPAHGGGGSAWAAAGAERLRAALVAATPSVARLRQVCELMDVRLVEIRRRWDSGALAAAGLSSGGVAHLVRALFEDTPPRRDLLRHLEERRWF